MADGSSTLLEILRRWTALQSGIHALRIPIATGVLLGPDTSYIRPRLVQAYLPKDERSRRRQMISASIALPFAGQERVTFSKLTSIPESGRGGSRIDVPLTEMLPSPRGAIALSAALVTLADNASADQSFETLQDFSAVVGSPLADKLPLVKTIDGAIVKMFERQDARVELAYYDDMVAADEAPVSPHHIAVFLAHSRERDPARFSVVADSLLYDGAPFRDSGFFLIKIEGQDERDDWRFPNFDELLKRAVEAALHHNRAEYEAVRRFLLTSLLRSPDLTLPDRRRLAIAVAEELNDVEEIASPGISRREQGAGARVEYARLPEKKAAAALEAAVTTEAVARRAITFAEAVNLSHLEVMRILANSPRG